LRFSPKIFTGRGSAGRSRDPAPLTRPEFFRLADECRTRATDYARYDQHRVNLSKCHEFNQWRAELQKYTELRPVLHSLRPARPIARWQILIIGAVVGVIGLLWLPRYFGQVVSTTLLYLYLMLLLIVGFLPERLYGTSIEQLEGKLLRIVDVLDTLLLSGEMEFTEAAFYQVKENLAAARAELRQQIDLAHRTFR
jgi:hypothetical protein